MGEILSKIGFDWRLAVANLVNFLIIFWILKKFAFEKIEEVINERKKRVQEGLENAKKAEEQVAQAEETKREVLLEAKKEGQEAIAKAHKNAEMILKHAEEEAFRERSDILMQAQRKIENERKEMESAVQVASAELIVEGARKALSAKSSPEFQNKVTDKFTQ